MICVAESARKYLETKWRTCRLSCVDEGMVRMNHIHNEAVLAFLMAHQDNPNVKRFIGKQDEAVREANNELGASHGGYIDYLVANIGDDASFTMDELKALLQPRFIIRLNEQEKKEYSYEEFDIRIDEFAGPVYIKDEGDFFSVWDNDGRIDIPLRFLDEFRKFFRENKVEYEDEFGGRAVLPEKLE